MEGQEPRAATETIPGLSLAQLAEQCGHSVRSLRAYIQIGVLHAGTRQGREARYDQTHIDRLATVSKYRSRGYTLASIADLFEAEDAGDDDVDLSDDRDIAHARALVESWIAEPTSYPTVGLLEEAFPQVTRFPKLVEAAIEHGIASLDGTELVIHKPEILRLGIDLLDSGVHLTVIVNEFRRFQTLLAPLMEQAGETFRALGYDAGHSVGLGRTYLLPNYLMTIGSILVTEIFDEAMHIDGGVIQLD